MDSKNKIAYKCIICEQYIDEPISNDVIHQYTEEPCNTCKKNLKDAYIFVLISAKSDKTRINRLHRTWVVDEKEVHAHYGESISQFKGERIIFINEIDAIEAKLLDERLTDPETGILFKDME